MNLVEDKWRTLNHPNTIAQQKSKIISLGSGSRKTWLSCEESIHGQNIKN
jgi:hypothetical protein